jgi:hypothetical protein
MMTVSFLPVVMDGGRSNAWNHCSGWKNPRTRVHHHAAMRGISTAPDRRINHRPSPHHRVNHGSGGCKVSCTRPGEVGFARVWSPIEVMHGHA